MVKMTLTAEQITAINALIEAYKTKVDIWVAAPEELERAAGEDMVKAEGIAIQAYDDAGGTEILIHVGYQIYKPTPREGQPQRTALCEEVEE